MFCPFIGQGTGDAGDPALGGCIRGDQNSTLERKHGGDIDDLSMTVGNHDAGGCLGEEKSRLEVDLQHIIPVGLAEFKCRCAADDPGIINQDIQMSQFGNDLCDGLLRSSTLALRKSQMTS